MARILAISSSGGHWEQLMLLREAFAYDEVFYANPIPGLAERSGLPAAFLVPDFNAQTPIRTLWGGIVTAALVVRLRPRIVLSTGAAPGLIALLAAKVLGCRTIWIDSIANAERLSFSGRLAGHFVDVWLTQWEHLAKPGGPHYRGAVL